MDASKITDEKMRQMVERILQEKKKEAKGVILL